MFKYGIWHIELCIWYIKLDYDIKFYDIKLVSMAKKLYLYKFD